MTFFIPLTGDSNSKKLLKSKRNIGIFSTLEARIRTKTESRQEQKFSPKDQFSTATAIYNTSHFLPHRTTNNFSQKLSKIRHPPPTKKKKSRPPPTC
jgi:hypothetical protein